MTARGETQTRGLYNSTMGVLSYTTSHLVLVVVVVLMVVISSGRIPSFLSVGFDPLRCHVWNHQDIAVHDNGPNVVLGLNVLDHLFLLLPSFLVVSPLVH